tara:strand:- start:2533 stop:3102 length:570 start_codon:yes stop_codon:yes gene_type:complete
MEKLDKPLDKKLLKSPHDGIHFGVSSSSGGVGLSSPLTFGMEGTTYGANILRYSLSAGQTFEGVLQGVTVTSFTVNMRRWGSMSGTLTAYIWKRSDNSVVGTFNGAISANSVSTGTSGSNHTFTHSGITTPSADWEIGVQMSGYSGSAPIDFIHPVRDTSNPFEFGDATGGHSTSGLTNSDIGMTLVWS